MIQTLLYLLPAVVIAVTRLVLAGANAKPPAMGLSRIEREGAKSRWTIVFGIAALLALGSFINALATYPAWKRQEEFREQGVNTIATVTKAGELSAMRISTLDVTYAFEVNGRPYELTNPKVVGQLGPGRKLPIRYLPSDPTQTIIKSQPPLPVSVAGTLVWSSVFCALGYFAWTKRKEFSQDDDHLNVEPRLSPYANNGNPYGGNPYATNPYGARNAGHSAMPVPSPTQVMPTGE